MTWMVYGANGYTGALIAELAVARGERPVLAGRNGHKVAAAAQRLGLEHRVFPLADAGAHLDGVDAVVNCAGPFSATWRPLVDACLRTRTHYLDITGEIDVFEGIAALDAEARRAGVVLLPGVGFDVVPTDCIAALLHHALPGATHLDLAFLSGGGPSAGTAATAVEGAAGGGRARVDGELRSVPLGHRRRVAGFRSGARDVLAIPWGDVSTAHRSTGIPNITTFTTFPPLLAKAHGVFQPLLALRPARQVAKALVRRIGGPSPAARDTSRSEVWGEVRDARGTRVEASLTTPNAYALTADSAVRAIGRLPDVEPGVHTPSSAFGAHYALELDDVVLSEPRAAR
ncbi:MULTISPECIES: saccharopine dehydrogenase family protein [Actinosynnema]|uniref:Saccharopine dehydrogenase n=1 Tax=Actinosynnema pretiosum TaxID=42197 RepID=A0A290Z1T5_9PSEU|nr:saccharopine dehydrogenase NADP-binding domain-containing protein [Actinosynnema pretiosum]ATE52996.1 saccharopine dehydrogenase [Actinosynnema pretiosum]